VFDLVISHSLKEFRSYVSIIDDISSQQSIYHHPTEARIFLSEPRTLGSYLVVHPLRRYIHIHYIAIFS